MTEKALASDLKVMTCALFSLVKEAVRAMVKGTVCKVPPNLEIKLKGGSAAKNKDLPSPCWKKRNYNSFPWAPSSLIPGGKSQRYNADNLLSTELCST